MAKPGAGMGRFLTEMGMALLEVEARDRFAKLEKTPLGHLLRAGFARRQRIIDEGREATDEDVDAFFADVPNIVAQAKAKAQQDDGER